MSVYGRQNLWVCVMCGIHFPRLDALAVGTFLVRACRSGTFRPFWGIFRKHFVAILTRIERGLVFPRLVMRIAIRVFAFAGPRRIRQKCIRVEETNARTYGDRGQSPQRLWLHFSHVRDGEVMVVLHLWHNLLVLCRVFLKTRSCPPVLLGRVRTGFSNSSESP